MIDWLLITTLSATVALHWLFELLPGKNHAMWCAELCLDPVHAQRPGRSRLK